MKAKHIIAIVSILTISMPIARASNDDHAVYQYTYDAVDGVYLTAYRVAALAFFNEKKIEDCALKERDFDVQFTKVTNDPSIVAITFYLKKDHHDQIWTTGGGQTTFEVDTKTLAIRRSYRNR